MAGAAALVAVTLIAESAPVAALAIRNVPALMTGCAIPVIQINVWAVRAVGVQDAPYYGEKIREPALFQGCLYGLGPFTFTELIVTYMRMGHFFRVSCRMRVQGDTGVGTGSVKLMQLIDIQLNLKRAKVGLFQGDGLSYDRERIGFLVIIYLAKLPLELLKLLKKGRQLRDLLDRLLGKLFERREVIRHIFG
jgi:hypothetical protein